MKRSQEPPRISDAEWEVMQVLWESAPRCAAEVAEALAPRRDWSDRTVKTLLGRLLKKGALEAEADGKRYLYRPRVEREECVRAEGQSFLRRVFGGEASPLLAHFVEEAELSGEEIDALRTLLARKAKEAGN